MQDGDMVATDDEVMCGPSNSVISSNIEWPLRLFQLLEKF